MSTLDLILIGIISIFSVYGFFSGLIASLFSLIGVIGGGYFALKFYGIFADKIPLGNPLIKNIAAFILIFIVFFFAVKIIAYILKKILFGPIKLLDKLAGLLLGFAEGFILSFIVVETPVGKVSLQPQKGSFSYLFFPRGIKTN